MQTASQRPLRSLVYAFLAGALLLAGAACGDRPAADTTPPAHDGAGHTTGNPHGMPPPGMPGHGMPAGGMAGHGSPSGPHWEWDTPRAWKTIAPKPLTEVTFAVPGDARAFVTLTVLARGGAPLDVVNRWRAQMGAAPLTALEDTAASRIELLGRTGHFVRIDGRHAGTGGENTLEDARLLGVLRDHAAGRVFLKMIGPRETVAAQAGVFRTWAGSLRRTTLPGVAVGSTPKEQRVTWTAPAGWRLQPPRPMREVTYKPSAASTVECSVTILGAGAADVAANLAIWRGQVGRPALSAEAIAALPRIRVLGREVAVLAAEGPFHGSGGQVVPDAALLGVVCPRGDHAVFVKMVGPRAEVLALREAFEAFCRSLRSAQ